MQRKDSYIGALQMSTTQNKAIIRRFLLDAWNEGRESELEDYVSLDNMHHSGTTDLAFGPYQIRQLMSAWRSAFPDTRYQIGTLLAEDDMVAARVTFGGTHRGVLRLGSRTIPATGKSFRDVEMFFFRIADGKIVESWAIWDRLNVLSQLGALSN